jgi:hypothetical protein
MTHVQNDSNNIIITHQVKNEKLYIGEMLIVYADYKFYFS